jgi:hypothetical protein
MQTIKKMKPKGKRKVQFPTISKDAAELGVTRIHLWNVLKGHRISKSLMGRYRALKAEQEGAIDA